MSKTLAILGCGHLGQQIANYAINDNHYQKVVFFDDFSTDKTVNGFSILGTSEAIFTEYDNKNFNALLIGIGYKHLKKRKFFYDYFKSKIPFGKIIHSSCWIDSSAKILDGSVIYPSCCVDANAVIEQNTIVNLSCTISHDTKVGKHCFLAPSVSLAGFVTIEDECILGINTTVIDNIRIKNCTQTGASTVVIKDINKAGVYVGNPHRLILKK
jgi:sugar O-acyltransferase (sialic acid O-acetyltransferase NeuD family)